LEVVEKILSAV